MGYITIEKSEGVAFVWLDQPDEKVNKITTGLLNEFEEVLNKIEKDSQVKAVVLISRKKDNFIAGADLDKFLAITQPGEAEAISRQGHFILNKIAGFRKPVVAAINGAALGGGLEVALACHYRIATDDPKTVLALPEVNLGILPAGGGTQRLPRLVGLRRGLDILLTGKNVYPVPAKKMGLVDLVTYPYGLDHTARQAALKLVDRKHSRKKKLSLLDKALEATSWGRRLMYKKARETVDKKTKGNYPAPYRILECVETGMEKGQDKGELTESMKFDELVRSPEAKELIRLFFNMNSRKKNPLKEHARPVQKIGVLGAGFMGASIADVSASKEFDILLKDISYEMLGKGKKEIYDDLTNKVKKHALSPFQRDLIMSRVRGLVDYDGFEKADLVIEAVFEDLELKKKVLQETEAQLRDDAVYASNTSSLPISRISEAAGIPERVIGMHYFSPVTKMPLLEIVITKKTAQWVQATALETGIRQGKNPIVVKDGPGFYTTRILGPMLNEAILLLEEGGDIHQIDQTMRQFGFPVGPLALIDEVGIDVGAHVSKVLGEMFAARGFSPSDKMKFLVEKGYKGRKNGKGFYSYSQGADGKKEVNQGIYQFFGGSSRRKIQPGSIQERLSLMMINEAVLCLQEDILQSPADGDLGAILGLGFPPFLGGPFHSVDKSGAGTVLDKLNSLQKDHGPRFKPAALLAENAKANRLFYSD